MLIHAPLREQYEVRPMLLGTMKYDPIVIGEEHRPPSGMYGAHTLDAGIESCIALCIALYMKTSIQLLSLIHI